MEDDGIETWISLYSMYYFSMDLLVLGHGEAELGDDVHELVERGIVLPPLVALGAVARVEDHLRARVQARLVPPHLPLLGYHPVLVSSLPIRLCVTQWLLFFRTMRIIIKKLHDLYCIVTSY
jgi:hypothetical protein